MLSPPLAGAIFRDPKECEHDSRVVCPHSPSATVGAFAPTSSLPGLESTPPFQGHASAKITASLRHWPENHLQGGA